MLTNKTAMSSVNSDVFRRAPLCVSDFVQTNGSPSFLVNIATLREPFPHMKCPVASVGVSLGLLRSLELFNLSMVGHGNALNMTLFIKYDV